MFFSINKYLIAVGLSFLSTLSYSFEYCGGTVNRLVSRDTHEGTEVQLTITDNGNSVVSGWARMGDGEGLTDHEKTQISFLLAALMAEKEVVLELIVENDQTFTSCSSFTRGIKVRNVTLKR